MLVLFPKFVERFARAFSSVALRLFGQRLGAMTVLTWQAALRFRLVYAILVLLLGAVIVLPSVLRHDGSARGFAQILLTYTLAAMTGLLGFSTLWTACGTLARDIEDCQIHTVMAKPIARWQIWLGKWLGIVTLNFFLLGVTGTVLFFLVQMRARQLSPAQQELLYREVLVARGSAREPIPDLNPDIDRIMAERMKNENVAAMDPAKVRAEIAKQVRGANEVVPSGMFRQWKIDLGSDAAQRLKNVPLHLRVKFFSSEYTGMDKTYTSRWIIGPVDSNRRYMMENSLAPETPVEFPIPPNLIGPDGVLTIDMQNWNEAALLYPLGEGMEVLYREGGFALNFFRGLLIIQFWLGLLAALGLAASSRMSFPVSSFVTLSLLLVVFSSGTIRSVIDQGGIINVDPETGFVKEANAINDFSVQVFKGLKTVIGLARDFSPIESLSTGRSITWGQVSRAFAQIVVFLGGILAAIGIVVLTKREIALPT